MRRALEIVVVFASASLAIAGACSGGDSGATGAGGDGGASSGTLPGTVAPASNNSSYMSLCHGGAPDLVCDRSGRDPEDCACIDCGDTALCIPGQCVPDGICTDKDACTCEECWDNAFCGDPQLANCLDDGACDGVDEGCLCADCIDDPNCRGFPGTGGGGQGGGNGGGGGSGGGAGAGGAGGGGFGGTSTTTL
jgi:hypothetical protein